MHAITTPAVFQFHAHQVRTVIRDGDPWFVAADVCSALGYANTSKAIGDHLDDDERSNEQLDRSRMGSKAVIISESGLYALVLRSRKPEARKFAKWVTSEVLPAIRKTGRYEAPAAQVMSDGLRNNVAVLADHMLWLRSWWAAHGPAIKAMNNETASTINDRFVDGALIEPCVLAGSRPGDIVLDPFFGSGTTGEVAQNLGRYYIGCELNRSYEALQIERTRQLSLLLEHATC